MSDVHGTGMSREQVEALEEMAQFLQDIGHELQEQSCLEFTGADLETAAADIRAGDLHSAANHLDEAGAQLKQFNTELLGSQLMDADKELEQFYGGER